MIVKMIQNFENKMELKINSLETRIEKMKEKFNKDLEEIKKNWWTIWENSIETCILSSEKQITSPG